MFAKEGDMSVPRASWRTDIDISLAVHVSLATMNIAHLMARQYRKHPELQGIGESVMRYLNRPGDRISDARRSVDPRNLDFLDKPVWHNKTDLDIFVAKELGLNIEDYSYDQSGGKHGNSFYNATVGVIRDLRVNGVIVDLLTDVPNTQKGVWRLNTVDAARFEEEMASGQMAVGNFHCRGEEGTTFVRSKQGVFKRILLEQYGYCLFCRFDLQRWMIGAHIVPFSVMRIKDPDNSMNPANGLLLCKLCDVAFEYGYILVEEDYGVTITDRLRENRNPAVRGWVERIVPEMRIDDGVEYRPGAEYLKRKKRIVLGGRHDGH